MKSYIEIPGPSKALHLPMIAFDKLDGSNLRFEWSRKRGWYKFGTRNRMFDETDKDFGSAIEIFLETFGESLDRIARLEYNGAPLVAFCEFFG